jgi:hypothetical protein
MRNLHPGPGGGSGMLELGGSYVTLKDFSSGDVTIVVTGHANVELPHEMAHAVKVEKV